MKNQEVKTNKSTISIELGEMTHLFDGNEETVRKEALDFIEQISHRLENFLNTTVESVRNDEEQTVSFSTNGGLDVIVPFSKKKIIDSAGKKTEYEVSTIQIDSPDTYWKVCIDIKEESGEKIKLDNCGAPPLSTFKINSPDLEEIATKLCERLQQKLNTVDIGKVAQLKSQTVLNQISTD